MITVIILATIAALVVVATVISVVRDGYGRVPARMATSRLAEHDGTHDIELRARESVSHTVTTARLA